MWQGRSVSKNRPGSSRRVMVNRILRSCILVLLIVSSINARNFPNASSDAESRRVLAPTNSVTSSKALPAGIEVQAGKTLLRVEALRDDVLRVRIAENGVLAEDASWAVLPEARTHRVNVSPQEDAATIGFRTAALIVRIDRVSTRLTVADLQGHILQSDAAGWPIDFHGASYRIYEHMPETEHYFGLGDKAGPLDRRNQCLTLWNTDYFRFQESDDPIYKSIPFFLTLNDGRSIGVLFATCCRVARRSSGLHSK